MRTLSPFTTRSLLNEFNTFFDTTARPQSNHQLFSTDIGWLIRIDLPGFKKEDLSLDFEDKAIVLTAEQNTEQENKRPSVTQRYALGEEVDAKNIQAKLEDGVLEITLPRKEEQELESKSINIQ
ncbi:Hsp20/alpha crystallin family protein [Rubritalea sp.]|uniref:Hsp20/alpha crystallin family protein n=1 Tax=Rubritalea sp. TaxID=2109375 RepID=UPI003EF37DE4